MLLTFLLSTILQEINYKKDIKLIIIFLKIKLPHLLLFSVFDN